MAALLKGEIWKQVKRSDNEGFEISSRSHHHMPAPEQLGSEYWLPAPNALHAAILGMFQFSTTQEVRGYAGSANRKGFSCFPLTCALHNSCACFCDSALAVTKQNCFLWSARSFFFHMAQRSILQSGDKDLTGMPLFPYDFLLSHLCLKLHPTSPSVILFSCLL